MILSVAHTTTYRYDMPVRGVVQSHRLRPSAFDGQRTEHWRVTVSDGIAGGSFRDGAGDWIESHSVTGPVDAIAVEVQGRVVTTDLAGLLRGHREVVAPEAYLRDTAPTRADRALVELAREAGGDGSDTLDRAHRLSAAVSDAVAYRPGTTEASTTAAEALAQGEGVCQDHAHVLVAMARVLAIPARYVSGYLAVDAGEEVALASEAAHAWAELHIRGYGWVGFDAANRCCPDARYIRLGSGYDAQDAAPIRGIARGPGAEKLVVSVAVERLEQ